MGYACGILTIVCGVFMTMVFCKDTSVFDKPGEKYTPPQIPMGAAAPPAPPI